MESFSVCPDYRNRMYLLIILSVVSLSFRTSDTPQNYNTSIEYVVTMDHPNNHYFHVSLTYSGIREKSVELKMPVWTPGYYMILDYPKNIINFRVTDESGMVLPFRKTDKNRWKISTEKSGTIRASYDVYAFRTSVAESFLDDGRGFISPTGIFMHPAGNKDAPVSVTIVPYEKFTRISTGLDPVPGRKDTFFAPDFDILYDCPILVGNQEILTFDSGGITYTLAVENLGNVDRQRFVEDHKRIVESSIAFIGEVPYTHYTFLIMNRGMGGLEHTNSMAVFSNRLDFSSSEAANRWLSFIAHEFFHLYNVKTIRPAALGPFDYDKENYTTMLWFSEGVTVYYENLIMNRAGFFDRDHVFRELKASIAAYENIPGHLFQSVEQSSFDSWMYFLNRSENAANTTISYYDKGCAIGLLIDLKIRYESGNRRSLDDVMRNLYQDYYKEKGRGFTDQEFRKVCEEAAGTSLEEIFDVYLPTVRDIDYAKYLAYAGLQIDTDPVELPGAWLGAVAREDGGNLLITSVEWGSPAYVAGLSPQDIIRDINGEKGTSALLNDLIRSKSPGEKLTMTVIHRDATNIVDIVLGKKTSRSFEIRPVSNPTPEQTAILDKWLK